MTILVGFALALFILGLSYLIENEALLNFIYVLSIFLTYIPLVLANKKLKLLAKDQKVDKRKLVSLDYSKVKIRIIPRPSPNINNFCHKDPPRL